MKYLKNWTDFASDSEFENFQFKIDGIESDMEKPQGDMHNFWSDMDKSKRDIGELKNNANETECETDEPQHDTEIWLNTFRTVLDNNIFSINKDTCFTFESIRLVNQRLSRLMTR